MGPESRSTTRNDRRSTRISRPALLVWPASAKTSGAPKTPPRARKTEKVARRRGSIRTVTPFGIPSSGALRPSCRALGRSAHPEADVLEVRLAHVDVATVRAVLEVPRGALAVGRRVHEAIVDPDPTRTRRRVVRGLDVHPLIVGVHQEGPLHAVAKSAAVHLQVH